MIESIKGTVIELRGDEALVEFANGDKRWFPTDGKDSLSKVGDTIEAVQSRVPQNQDELFEFLERRFIRLPIQHFVASWVEHEGEPSEAECEGVSIRISDVVDVFGAPSDKHFFLKDLAEDAFYCYEYSDISDMECALRQITELTNAAKVTVN